MSEKVLVIQAEELDKLKGLPGISTDDKNIQCLHWDCTQSALFVDRDKAETNEDLKQVIPYVVVRRGRRVLAYMRSKKSGEGRLRNKWSVGIGGHINPQDDIGIGGFTTVLSMAISRELSEELEWGDLFDHTVTGISQFGIIYDDSDEVGRVHLGYVLVVDLPVEKSDYPRPGENTISRHEWYEPREAVKLSNLEGWSKLVLEAMTA